ncbi:PP2C family protein-serine/threonine phosphatase [Streptomyces yaizuensis]|uniref:Serine/threonine-protein phosphatase n=1 Tax=Streptomyces yaizuensis TaxID=2989713 RepID=A0ABQ5P0N6_9ACTN|nr:PP2C family protein-serine/threonine phosphatase [Streptomyces sp. YSPA8]GLF95781.1 serine/threonine-protein phosphatase [Streptomyces sp. YSPA8]
MSAPHLPKVAGINSSLPPPAHTAAALSALPATATGEPGGAPSAPVPVPGPVSPDRMVQDRLAGCVTDLATLHDLTERLARTRSLDSALQELLHAGAALVGARRGLVILEPPPSTPYTGTGRLGERRRPALTRGLGLTHAEIGHIETIPRSATAYGRILESRDHSRWDGTATKDPVTVTGQVPGKEPASAGNPVPGERRADANGGDVLGDLATGPRGRDVALRLGCAACCTQPLATETAGTLGAVVWLYDEPGAPTERRRRLAGLYTRYATEHLARLLEVEQARETVTAVTEELLPSRLPQVPGVRLAARHRAGAHGGGDWYDALPLPEGALGLAVGSVGGSGPGTPAVMGRLRASLRAYAVMEGEDPVAVLSDLELLLRLTEPSRTATALFAHAEPAAGRMVLAGAGHTPPLVIGERRTEFVETSLSAPLGMLACWEAPSVELSPAPGETVLLYTDGLLRQTGDTMDRAFARLHAAAASVPRAARETPGAVADHVLQAMLPPDGGAGDEDVVLLAARFG